MSEEFLGTPGMAALRSERGLRRNAEVKIRQLKTELHAAREKAELWEYRAKRYSDERNIARAEISRIKTTKETS